MKEVKEREMVKGTLPVDSLSRGVTPIVASVLFCQVDNHDGVAGDRSARVGRSVLDLLPVVHPVDLEGSMF